MMVNSQVLSDWPISEQFFLALCEQETFGNAPWIFSTVLHVLVVLMQGAAGLPAHAGQCETFGGRHCQMLHGRTVQRFNGVLSAACSDGSK